VDTGLLGAPLRADVCPTSHRDIIDGQRERRLPARHSLIEDHPKRTRCARSGRPTLGGMETSLTAGVCVVVIGVLWRNALEESAPGWLRATGTAVIVIGVAAVTVTLTVYAVVGPIAPRTLATLLVVAGVIGMLVPWS
jgi:hypothetical protein